MGKALRVVEGRRVWCVGLKRRVKVDAEEVFSRAAVVLGFPNGGDGRVGDLSQGPGGVEFRDSAVGVAECVVELGRLAVDAFEVSVKSASSGAHSSSQVKFYQYKRQFTTKVMS